MQEKSQPEESELQRHKRLPVICEACGAHLVVAIRAVDRVLIYCESCGARIYAYYTDANRHPVELPPEDEDRLLIRQVEHELLREASQPAAALYSYLRRYIRHYGYAPTLREMQREFNWASANTASYHLARLEATGLIERDYGEVRGIRLPHAA